MKKRCFTIIGVLMLMIQLHSCNEQSTTKNTTTIKEKPAGNNINTNLERKIISNFSYNINCILQDKKGSYWFGTNGQGVYKYDGTSLIQLTEKDGLCSNHVSAIQEDTSGNLWFSTSKGLCTFNAVFFTNFTDTLKNTLKESLQYKSDNLFFEHEGNVYQYDGLTFTKFPIHPANYQTNPANLDRHYGIYCMLKDNAGNIWFGTDQKGVCRYNGKTFTFFTEKGLSGAAVRTIFQDTKGNLWFGNNGFGLFCYDGKILTNVTEEKGLGNDDFIKKTNTSKNYKNLARVWSINQDKNGKLWIGTIDAGVWNYDGNNLKNFTTKDGITNNINTIYKDNKGDLWFITEGDGIYRFNGDTFKKFTIGPL